MPDIHHEWARNPPDRWHCKHCPATTWNPVQAVCPGRVLPKAGADASRAYEDSVDRMLGGPERESVMPVSEVRALLEGLRDRIRTDAAHLDMRSSSTRSANHHKAEQARKDARRLDDALTTLTGSDQ